MLSVDEFLSNEYEKISPTFSVRGCHDVVSFTKWKENIKKECLKVLSIDGSINYKIITESIIDNNRSFQIKRIYYRLHDSLDCPCYLMIPKQTIKGIVLAFHGHGIGAKDIIGILPNDSYQKKFALELCNHGFIVIAPEFLGFGNLRLKEDIASGNDEKWSCHRLAMNLLAYGKTLLGFRVEQAIVSLRLARYLFPKYSIGVMGISGGGTIATLLSILDCCDDLTACVISGYANTFRNSIFAMEHCECNYLPGMLKSFELPNLLSAIAPKPMLWESGTNDPIYPYEGTKLAEEIVHECYKKFGNPQNFVCDYFDGVHEIHGDNAFRFLEKYLLS